MSDDFEETIVRPISSLPFKKEERDNSVHSSLVVVHGELLGTVFQLSKLETMLGRSPSCDITISGETISRNHAMIAKEDATYWLVDQQSANGTIVNDQPVGKFQLSDGDLIKIGSSVLKFVCGSSMDASVFDELHRRAVRDALTGAYNRAYFDKTLNQELSRAKRHGRPVCVALLDIDFFKKVNDTYGHPAGDTVLITLARLLRENLRAEDGFARLGGEEFGVILPELTLDQAVMACDKLRRVIEEYRFSHEGVAIPVTASIGVCSVHEESVNCEPDAAVKTADVRLYQSKEGGRNRVTPLPQA